MKLILIVTLLSSASAAPYVTDFLSHLWYGYTPSSVRRTLYDAFDEGSELLRDITLDIQDDFDVQIKDRVVRVAEIGEETFYELHSTVNYLVEIVTGGELDEESAIWEKTRIVQLREQIQEVATNLTMEDEESRSRLEAKVQYLLKELKVMLAEDAVADSFFSRLDRIKFQTQRTRWVLLQSLTELGQIFKSFFDTVSEKEKTFVANRNQTINGTDYEDSGNQNLFGTEFKDSGNQNIDANGTDYEFSRNQTTNGTDYEHSGNQSINGTDYEYSGNHTTNSTVTENYEDEDNIDDEDYSDGSGDAQ